MTIIEALAGFSLQTRADELPEQVKIEARRILFDSIGCAVAGVGTDKGHAAVEMAALLGGPSSEATIMGSEARSSLIGASFANGELINALDFDTILPPGHVAPYVIPGALAMAERRRCDGAQLLAALAVAHEMSFRFGAAMDGLRDTSDGGHKMPDVFGYSSTIFGATAAISLLAGCTTEVLRNALAIAAMSLPVNSFRAWCMLTPPTSLKYLSGGLLAQAAITSSHMAAVGYTAHSAVLDDTQFGFASYIGTSRWEPAAILDGLGTDWRFPDAVSYKPYPHARGSHGALDALTGLIQEHDLQPGDITEIRAWGESFAARYPVWQYQDFHDAQDAQYSVVHALSLAAHRIPAGTQWRQREVVFDESVLGLMKRTSYREHPDYAGSLSRDARSRPTRVEIDARGETFVGECMFPKGTPSTDPSTAMTDEELIDKFRANTIDCLGPRGVDAVVDAVFRLEEVDDVSKLMRMTAGGDVQ